MVCVAFIALEVVSTQLTVHLLEQNLPIYPQHVSFLLISYLYSSSSFYQICIHFCPSHHKKFLRLKKTLTTIFKPDASRLAFYFQNLVLFWVKPLNR